jgi:hypothetical protein
VFSLALSEYNFYLVPGKTGISLLNEHYHKLQQRIHLLQYGKYKAYLMDQYGMIMSLASTP